MGQRCSPTCGCIPIPRSNRSQGHAFSEPADRQCPVELASSFHLSNVLFGTDGHSGNRISFAGDLGISYFPFTHHDCLKFIEMPRPKIVSVDPNIERQGERFIRKIAMRMSIEVPSSLSVVRPNSHGIVTKHDPLLRHMNLREKSPGREQLLLFAGCLVVIAFDEVDRFTSQPITVGDHLFFSPYAEIPKEVEDIVRLYAGIQPFSDHIIHLS